MPTLPVPATPTAEYSSLRNTFSTSRLAIMLPAAANRPGSSPGEYDPRKSANDEDCRPMKPAGGRGTERPKFPAPPANGPDRLPSKYEPNEDLLPWPSAGSAVPGRSPGRGTALNRPYCHADRDRHAEPALASARGEPASRAGPGQVASRRSAGTAAATVLSLVFAPSRMARG